MKIRMMISSLTLTRSLVRVITDYNMICFKVRCMPSSMHCVRMMAAGKKYNMNQQARKRNRAVIKKMPSKVPAVNAFRVMTVSELAELIDKDVNHIYECMRGIPTTATAKAKTYTQLNKDVITTICRMSGFRTSFINRPSHIVDKIDENAYPQPPAELSQCLPRPPVVTIMGHVDHGKTTLLDYLRKSNIVDQEFGGITQHIGAFSVRLKKDKSITFLDTPGHAAFSSMRGRGAKITDIVILVVAADDGIMPQTIESINHAAKYKVPIIVAINKCDKVTADIQNCKEELSLRGLVLEEKGGDVQCVEISALKGTNVDALKEAILVQAELLNLCAAHSGPVEGRVIEAKTDPGRGKLASVLVQRGMLKKSAFLVAGQVSVKVRSMFDENNKQLQNVGPGQTVEILGWKELPSPGDEVLEVPTEKRMHAVVNYRKRMLQELKAEDEAEQIKAERKEHNLVYREKLKMRYESGLSLRNPMVKRRVEEQFYQPEVIDETPVLALVIKADVDGSQEAIMNCLDTYDSEECRLDIISADVGVVNENDIEVADAFDGTIFAFNTTISDKVNKLATDSGVAVHHHNVIYKLFDDVKDMLNGKVSVKIEHKTVGEAIVQQVFTVTEKINGKNKKIFVAGCKCVQGQLVRSLFYKLIRGTTVLYAGQLYSLKHFKDEVMDIIENQECGLVFDDHSLELQEGDIIFCYEELHVKPRIEWNLPF